jgi:PIN domain nuclease of toxin-antitoxin system
MRVLLDTHAFLWANAEPDRLGSWREVVEDLANELLLSAASSWELATKAAIGRLHLPEPVASYVPSRMATLGITGVSVEHRHALAVAALPMHHRDPFDRILIAQAQLLGVPILTADAAFDGYDVEVLRVP